jgi:hypothetical protein
MTVKAQDHPDYVGGWIWTNLELTYINYKIEKAIAAEREACAKLAEEPYEFTSEEAHRIAASIRARANDVL